MLCIPFMHGVRRLTTASAAAVSLVGGHVAAQPVPAASPEAPTAATASSPEPIAPPAETLETPYEEPAPAAPAAPPASAPAPRPVTPVVPALPDTRPLLPIRAQRRISLTAEMGWNGLAGFGPVLTYHVHPHFSADLGLGLSLLGGKAGLRARYNLLTSPFTPFIGVGFNSTTGFGRFTTDPKSDPNGDPEREPATIDVPPAYLVQGVVGVDYIHRRGFTLVACAGYSQILNGNGYDKIDGTLTADEEKGFGIAFNGGLVVTLALGYSFK